MQVGKGDQEKERTGSAKEVDGQIFELDDVEPTSREGNKGWKVHLRRQLAASKKTAPGGGGKHREQDVIERCCLNAWLKRVYQRESCQGGVGSGGRRRGARLIGRCT